MFPGGTIRILTHGHALPLESRAGFWAASSWAHFRNLLRCLRALERCQERAGGAGGAGGAESSGFESRRVSAA